MVKSLYHKLKVRKGKARWLQFWQVRTSFQLISLPVTYRHVPYTKNVVDDVYDCILYACVESYSINTSIQRIDLQQQLIAHAQKIGALPCWRCADM